MEKSDITEVVMVGGTTKTPIVQQKVAEYFDNAIKVNCEIDPDTVVAYGATVYAGKLTGQLSVHSLTNELVLSDVTPMPIGLL